MPYTQKKSAKDIMEKVELEKVRKAARKPAKKKKKQADVSNGIAKEITRRKAGIGRILKYFGGDR